MDAFDDEHRVAAQLQLLAVIFPFARHEVILGYLHTLSLHQSEQMVFEQRIFHRLNIVEVIVAVGQLGGVQTVHEVVVRRERHRSQSAGEQLHGEAFAEGGLA